MMHIFLWSLLLSFFGVNSTQTTTVGLPASFHQVFKQSPVVVELFSSEGCSSCPAADETMSGIIAQAQKENKPVYIIDFHVDYFDRLGWKDSLAHPDFTKRQYRYMEVFRLSSAYTPQAIINGKKESSGSDDVKLNRLIGTEMKAAARARVVCTAKMDPSGRRLDVNYKVAGAINNSVINFALYEEKVVHQILKGENAGKTLSHNNVVWSFIHQDLKETRGTKTLDLANDTYKLLVYIQDKSTLEVIAAADVKISR